MSRGATATRRKLDVKPRPGNRIGEKVPRVRSMTLPKLILTIDLPDFSKAKSRQCVRSVHGYELKLNFDDNVNSKSIMKVHTRTNRSIPMFITQRIVNLFNSQLIKPGDPYPAGSPRLEVHKKAKRRCRVDESVVEDIYLYHLIPRKPTVPASSEKPTKRKRLYYFAGGGWQSPPASEHWILCAELANKLPDSAVSIVSYPLAPNSPAPISFPHLMRLCKRLLQEAQDAGESVVLAGDSAGGNIVLCLALALLAEDEHAPCPTTTMVISPSCDLRRDNPEIECVQKHDPILRIPFIRDTANKWRGDWDAADPRITPLLADVELLARRGVKIYGVSGRYDINAPDAMLFRTKCEQAGVEGEWLDWDKQMHCFPLAFSFRLPESVAAKDWILDVLRKT